MKKTMCSGFAPPTETMWQRLGVSKCDRLICGLDNETDRVFRIRPQWGNKLVPTLRRARRAGLETGVHIWLKGRAAWDFAAFRAVWDLRDEIDWLYLDAERHYLNLQWDYDVPDVVQWLWGGAGLRIGAYVYAYPQPRTIQLARLDVIEDVALMAYQHRIYIHRAAMRRWDALGLGGKVSMGQATYSQSMSDLGAKVAAATGRDLFFWQLRSTSLSEARLIGRL